MNIKEFKEGDLVTRNAPCSYGSEGHADSSWCGDKMKFLGINEEAKIFYVQFMDGHFKDTKEPHQFSYARDPWNEGWIAFPERLYDRAKALMGL